MSNSGRNTLVDRLCLTALLAILTVFTTSAMANHPVLVEGESDFDGDGLLGTDEDNDGDQVFGTINAALQVGIPGAVNQNGRVTIVTSGRFLEQVNITAAGVVVLEAAPGVTANIEAFAPNNAGNVTRQNQPAIVVNGGQFPVVLRNLVLRNWTVGVVANGGSRVSMSNIVMDSNVNFGVLANDESQVVIKDSEINGTGCRRSGTEGIIAANPGVGIRTNGSAAVRVEDSTIAFSVGRPTAGGNVQRIRVTTSFNNIGNCTVPAS